LLRMEEPCERRIALTFGLLTRLEAARFRIVRNSHPSGITIASPPAPSQVSNWGGDQPQTLAELVQTSRPPFLEQTVDFIPT
jgi:hypothetical protein